MRQVSIFLEKIVFSFGIGNKKTDLKAVADHFIKLINVDQKVKITKAKKGIAKWNLRANDECGIVLTLRKQKMFQLLKKLDGANVFENAVFSGNTLSTGVNNHRKLKFEKYNLKAPEYGFNVAIVFGFKGLRCYKRKFNRIAHRPQLDWPSCKKVFENALQSQVC